MGAHGEFFARAVKDRRNSLNLSMQRAHARGAPAVPTQVKVENNELTKKPHTGTLAKYDEALEWVPGSASAAFFEGREPLRLEDRRELVPGTAARTLTLEQVLPLLDAQRTLHEAGVAGLPAAMDQLDLAITGVIGPFITDLLERNHGSAPSAWMEIAFGEALSVPVPPDDPAAEERHYRRWLSGRIEGLDADTIAHFEQRYNTRLAGPA